MSTQERVQKSCIDGCARGLTAHETAYSNRRMIVCHMNKNRGPIFSGNENEEKQEQSSSKPGVWRRVRRVFSGNKKDDDGAIEERDKEKDGYKPNALDAVRLRLAMAMSNISFLQFGKSEEWVVACPKTKVGPGQIVPCVVNGLDIIIFASRDGQRLDAFANACPHLGSPFDLATVERKPVIHDEGRKDDGTGDGCVDCIVCPVHRTAFEIQSGNVRGDWCPYPPILGGVMGYVKPKTNLVKFACRLRGKNVEVRIATSVKNVGEGEEQAAGLTDIK